MIPKRIFNISWSATGNTKKVTAAITDGLNSAFITSMPSNKPKQTDALGLYESAATPFRVFHIDFTSPFIREATFTFEPDDLVIIGSPTYAGKLPNKILPDFQTKLIGNQTPVIAVVTYGNRSYDNALAELVSVLENNHFCVVGAATFACRHSFSDKLAPGRPNADDLDSAKYLGTKIAEKMLTKKSAASLRIEKVPGNASAPYYIPKGVDGTPAKFLKANPVTNPEKCTNCGTCASTCPMTSIDASNPGTVNGICIKCQACIRNCPTHAKYFDDPAFLSHVEMLETNYTAYKENEFFF